MLAFAHPGPASEDVVEVVAELRERGASTRLAGPVAGSDISWPAPPRKLPHRCLRL